MVTSSPIAGIPIPELSDGIDINVALGDISNSLDTMALPRFTTTANRDSAITTPIYGQMCYVSGTDELYVYKKQYGSWVSAASRVRRVASDFSTSSTSVFLDVTDLTYSVESDSTYYGRLHLIVRGDVGGDVKFRMRGPSGATIRTSFMHQLATTATAKTHTEVNAFTLWQTQDVILGTLSSASSDSCTFNVWIDISSTSGNIVHSFVRNAASTNASVVGLDSYLEIWKVR